MQKQLLKSSSRIQRSAASRIAVLMSAMTVIMSVVFAMVLPLSWGRSTGPFGFLTDSMIKAIPNIGRLGALSAFPGVTETLLSLMWVVIPIISTVFVWKAGIYNTDSMGELRHKFGFIALLTLFLGPLLLGPFLIPITANDMSEPTLSGRVLRRMSGSRIWLGGVAAIFCLAYSVALGLVVSIIKNARYLFLGHKR